MKTIRILVGVISGIIFAATSARAVDGTYTVTEDWSVTLEYDQFGRGDGFTGTKHFSGRETGTLVITDGEYRLINRSGFQIQGGAGLLERSINCFDGFCTVSGSYAFGPGYNARAYGVLFLGCFVVKVPLIDGEVPIFYDFDRYEASGNLSSMHGYGSMTGDSLRVRITSTFSFMPKSTPSTTPPHIIVEPRDVTVDYGRKTVLAVRANGTPPLVFQWWKDGTMLPGQNAPQLVIDQATSLDAGNYSVMVANSFGAVTSEAGMLMVRPPVPPVIKLQPRNKTVTLGRKLRLVTRAKGSPPLDYQWFFNDNAIPGANTNSLVVPAVTALDGGNYFAVVSNAAGSVTSHVAAVTIRIPPAANQ